MMDNRAKTNGLLLKKINVKAMDQSTGAAAVLGAPQSPYKNIDLSVTISGPYASALNFLTDLEQSLRLIDISNLTFTVAPVDVYEFNISARTYSVSSTTPVATFGAGGGNDTKQILAMLTKLRSIKIDLDFFNNDIYKSLIDFTPTLETSTSTAYGRINPFAPI